MTDRSDWTDGFFDEKYAKLWGFPGRDVTATEVAALRVVLPQPPTRIVDVACGNGRHAIALAAGGYEVMVVDIAAPFLHMARLAADAASVAVEFRQADMRDLDLEGFDAALVLGNSFGYHSDEDNVRSLGQHCPSRPPGRSRRHRGAQQRSDCCQLPALQRTCRR
ncbi:hypothetical protein BH24ACT15_BH24ACT15_37450 [soil metagenome]